MVLKNHEALHHCTTLFFNLICVLSKQGFWDLDIRKFHLQAIEKVGFFYSARVSVGSECDAFSLDWIDWRWVLEGEYKLGGGHYVSIGYLVQNEFRTGPDNRDRVLLFGYKYVLKKKDK